MKVVITYKNGKNGFSKKNRKVKLTENGELEETCTGIKEIRICP